MTLLLCGNYCGGVGVASLGRSSADCNQRENGEANNRNDDGGNNSKRQPEDFAGGFREDWKGDIFAVVHGFAPTSL